MSDLEKLRRKLCRELAQSEHDAKVHTLREAKRLGTASPAVALRAIARHAEEQRPRFEMLMRRQPAGLQLGRAVGVAFSALRHFMFDRLIDHERSYRGTLLGCKHGLDVVRLLREVALRSGDSAVVRFCDDQLVERIPLLEAAERELAWFADCPTKALRSGLRVAFESAK